MRFLLISLLFLVYTSCALPMTKDWVKSETTQEFVVNNYFSDFFSSSFFFGLPGVSFPVTLTNKPGNPVPTGIG